jgi:hypothetical protein
MILPNFATHNKNLSIQGTFIFLGVAQVDQKSTSLASDNRDLWAQGYVKINPVRNH